MELVNGKWKWTEAEKQAKRELNQNLVWINNGNDSKRIKKTESIPDGWLLGRLITWKFTGPKTQQPEANLARSKKLLGRVSPNKGKPSPKKGLTEVEYYGEDKANELAKLRSETHTGKKPWNFGIPCSDETKAKIGAANESSDARSSVRYGRWVKAVLDRDQNRCQHCGNNKHKFGEQLLYAHHIKDWENHLLLRFTPENGLTLCNSCHPRLENTLRVLRRNGFSAKTVFLNDATEICSKCHRLTGNGIDGAKPCSCSN